MSSEAAASVAWKDRSHTREDSGEWSTKLSFLEVLRQRKEEWVWYWVKMRLLVVLRKI